MSLFTLGAIVYMVGFLVQQAHVPAGRITRLFGAVIVVLSLILPKL